MVSPHREIFSVFVLRPPGLPAGSEALPAGSEALPASFEALPAASETLPAGSKAHPSGSEAFIALVIFTNRGGLKFV